MEQGKRIAGIDFPIVEVPEASQAQRDGPIPLINQKNLNPEQIRLGEIGADAGRATGEMLVCAIRLCKKGDISGFTFAPYNKAAMEYGGYPLVETGHRCV